MSLLAEKYEYMDVPDAEVSPENKAWIILLAQAKLTVDTLQFLKTQTICLRERAKVNKGSKSEIMRFVAQLERKGTDFINTLREFEAFYLTSNRGAQDGHLPMAELLKDAYELVLNEAPGRMNQLHAHLASFAMGQYRDIDPRLFEAIEDFPDEPEQAVSSLVDLYCPKANKMQRKNLATALQQLLHTQTALTQ